MMSFLTDENLINNLTNKLDATELLKRKCLFIEGIIRFLQLYAQNEIGDVKVDIEKVALYVNSAAFENSEVVQYRTIEDVYSVLENDLYNNIPLFRFLKLSEHQRKIFEQDHYDLLLADYKKDCEIYPCLKCIWYDTDITSLGRYSVCNLPEYFNKSLSTRRRGYLDITKKATCTHVATLDDTDYGKEYRNHKVSRIRHSFNSAYNAGVENLKRKIANLDNCIIPPYIPEDDHVDLDAEIDWTKELGRAYNNKLSYSDIKKNHIRAIFLEGMINFIEIYAKTELGANYIADIFKIAEYVYNHTLNFTSVEQVYEYLENLVYTGEDVSKFCKPEIS